MTNSTIKKATIRPPFDNLAGHAIYCGDLSFPENDKLTFAGAR
jgi:hypothetical protein